MELNGSKPHLLVLSHVLPFPRRNGQQQRVYYTLQAARDRFQTTFLTCVDPRRNGAVQQELLTVCDRALLLQSRYGPSPLTKLWHRSAGLLFSLQTGLKFSNYLVGKLEFGPAQVGPALDGTRYDCVLFEYWHAAATVPLFRRQNIPCILDMHNVLWQSHLEKLKGNSIVSKWWKRRSIRNYQQQEEASWREFDAVIAITREEYAYVKPRVPDSTRVFYAPMGVDLAEWPFSWQPARPPRIAFYGGLSSAHNQESALRCYEKILPAVWRTFPETELWLVGSNPPPRIQALAADPRVKVTGYVEKVQDVLRTMTAVLCPWKGTYGFRSRLVEAMALGVPVVATPEAVKGMELEENRGLLLGDNDVALAAAISRLLQDQKLGQEQSEQARRQVESLYSMANTYGRLTDEMHEWLRSRKKTPAG